MEGIRGVEALTVNEMVIHISQILTPFFIGNSAYNSAITHWDSARGSDLSSLLGNRNPGLFGDNLWQQISGFRCDVQQNCQYSSSILCFALNILLG
jgi:hypothetical protein